jgi:hypothetical protein
MCGRGILDLPYEVFSNLVQSDLLAAHEVDIFKFDAYPSPLNTYHHKIHAYA